MIEKPKRKRKRNPEGCAALKKKCDAVFSLYIRHRDKGICITCGRQGEIREMQAGHYISRTCLALRFDPRNVNCQCYACNCMKHGDLITYREKLVELYGEEMVLELEDARHQVVKKTAEDYHAMIDKYKELLKRYHHG